MPQRLSPRESRRLQRRFLRLDEGATRPTMLLAGGAAPPMPRPAPARRPERPPQGPYEWEYPVSDGYAAQRVIVVP